MSEQLRNIAIIAHVDHGKTTLVDRLLQQSGTMRLESERVMDSNDLERERGITILAKNTAITWQDWRINIVDTPGHADFGGEVERVLSMVDAVLLLVDAVDGPMPQTRFVTQKAFAYGLRPLVVINKIDRPGARPEWVLNQTFELFDKLGATEEQLDFPVIYASALHGYAGTTPEVRDGDMTPLFEAIVRHTPPPRVQQEGPLQMRISSLDYNTYTGVLGIGRIERGTARPGMAVTVVDTTGATKPGKLLQVLGFLGLERREVPEAHAGDIIAISGLDELDISYTICDAAAPAEPLPPLAIDEPTVAVSLLVNNSPLAGTEGRFITSRQLRDRLLREAKHNVALRVLETEEADRFQVMGRGTLHLAILLEQMRREGYEMAVSRPEVLIKEEDGQELEPYEYLVLDVEEDHQGALIALLGERFGEMLSMETDGQGRSRLAYRIPSRSLIGFRSLLLTMTSGTGLAHAVFDGFGPRRAALPGRNRGALIANGAGKTVAYALFALQERGRLMVGPGEDVYEGMVIGLHSRGNDLVVNPLRAKQLTNIRAAGSDENIILTPPVRLTLEQALEFIADDELVEITPKSIRVRKKYLLEHERKRMARLSA
jgi:GTP-binding protein